MAVYLDEEMVAADANEIIFPHLLLCAGVVCLMSDNTVIGAHISNSVTEDAVLAELADQVANSGAAPQLLYIITNVPEHIQHTDLSFTAKAGKLGYVGDIKVLNTNAIQTGDGTFARVVTGLGGANCLVYAVADQNARPYQTVAAAGYAGPAIMQIRSDRPAAAPRFVKIGDSAARGGPAVGAGEFATMTRH